MKKLAITIAALMFAFPVVAKQDKEKGAGGVRVDHASEMGLDKGNAWAGSKEKDVPDEKEKGEGTGGIRDDHASDTGLDKGKAWAGDKGKNVKEQPEDKEKKEKKEKKSK